MALRFSSNNHTVSKRRKIYFSVTRNIGPPGSWWIEFNDKCQGPYETREDAITDGEKRGWVLI